MDALDKAFNNCYRAGKREAAKEIKFNILKPGASKEDVIKICNELINLKDIE